MTDNSYLPMEENLATIEDDADSKKDNETPQTVSSPHNENNVEALKIDNNSNVKDQIKNHSDHKPLPYTVSHNVAILNHDIHEKEPKN